MRSKVVTQKNERLTPYFGKEEQVSPQHGAGEPDNAAAGFSAHLRRGPLFVPKLARPDYQGSTTHRRTALVSTAAGKACSNLAII